MKLKLKIVNIFFSRKSTGRPWFSWNARTSFQISGSGWVRHSRCTNTPENWRHDIRSQNNFDILNKFVMIIISLMIKRWCPIFGRCEQQIFMKSSCWMIICLFEMLSLHYCDEIFGNKKYFSKIFEKLSPNPSSGHLLSSGVARFIPMMLLHNSVNICSVRAGQKPCN